MISFTYLYIKIYKLIQVFSTKGNSLKIFSFGASLWDRSQTKFSFGLAAMKHLFAKNSHGGKFLR